MKGNTITGIMAFTLVAIFVSSPVLAVTVDRCSLVDVYNVSSANYTDGGSTLTIIANVSWDASTANANVSALISFGSTTYNYILSNSTPGGIYSNNSLTVPSTSYTSSSIYNVSCIAAEALEGKAAYNVTIGVDATDPNNTALTTGDNSNNFTWYGITGQSKVINATITDNFGISRVIIDFTSVPSGSAKTDSVMTCSSGGTSSVCNYTFTPDKLGVYQYRINIEDNVTNTHNSTNYQAVTFRLKGSSLPINRMPLGEVSTGTGSIEDGQLSINRQSEPFDIFGSVGGMFSGVFDGIGKILSPVFGIFNAIGSLLTFI